MLEITANKITVIFTTSVPTTLNIATMNQMVGTLLILVVIMAGTIYTQPNGCTHSLLTPSFAYLSLTNTADNLNELSGCRSNSCSFCHPPIC